MSAALPAGAHTAPGRPNPVAEATTELDRIDSEEATLAELAAVKERQVVDRYRFGGLLAKLRDRCWYGGYSSFVLLVERRFGIGKSTAYAAIALYTTLRGLDIAWEQVKDIDVTKLSFLCAKRAAGRLTREGFSKQLERARAMTFRQLVASFGPRRPPYLSRRYPQRTAAEIVTWMRINGGDKVFAWCRQAFPSWRPREVIASMFGQSVDPGPAEAALDHALAPPRVMASGCGP